MSEAKEVSVDLTKGPIGRQILQFTVPLLLGNIFQQFYNAADTVIVGKFVGREALAAVGSSGALINLLVSILMGVAVGAGVVVSRYYGAKQYTEMRATIHTTIAFGLIAGAVMSVLGVAITPVILRWMQTPESVMASSVLYFRIYFAGVLTTVMYNIGSGIYRALGDSKRPLYFLIISTIINIVLDLLFVAVFHMSIGGAAVATVVAQGLSMVLVFYKMMREDTVYRVSWREIRIHRRFLRQIIAIGLPSGIQNGIVSLSNVVVQSNINSFGDIAMAGCGAYNKLDGFALLPAGSFSLALSTFVSQNIGAEQYDRAKKGAAFGLVAAMAISELAGVFIYFAAPQLVGFFNDDPEVIRYGVLMARNIVFAYALVAYSNAMAGVLRGGGPQPGAHVRHGGLLVRPSGALDPDHDPPDSGHPGGLLVLPHYLDGQRHHPHHLFLQGGLAPQGPAPLMEKQPPAPGKRERAAVFEEFRRSGRSRPGRR